MAKIKSVQAREILNSKGDPTIEATVILSDGAVGVSSVPSGTSIGKYEALELRDNDEKRYNGLGVLNAINNIYKVISPAILGMEASNISAVDKRLIEVDGTPNKQRLGANAVLSVSIAVAKAAARSAVLPTFLYLREFTKKTDSLKIPTPSFNILNGGKHGDGNIDFQEFLAIPASSKTFSEDLLLGTSVYSSLKKVLKNNNLSTLRGLEGGFSPKLGANQDGLFLIKQAMEAIDLRLGFDMFIGLDPAANGFYNDGGYRIKDKTSSLNSSEMIDFYTNLNSQYHLLYLEDGLTEDDWKGWQDLYTALSKMTLIVGDDLVASNPYRLQEAIQKRTIGGVIIKPNQIGTVIESIAVAEMAKQAGLKITVSHRSAETTDDFIADFSVAVGADYVKFGAPVQGERVTKYNRLLSIEKQIQSL
jgi:enolase